MRAAREPFSSCLQASFSSFEFCMSSIDQSMRSHAHNLNEMARAQPQQNAERYSNREKDIHGNSQFRLQDVESVLTGG